MSQMSCRIFAKPFVAAFPHDEGVTCLARNPRLLNGIVSLLFLALMQDSHCQLHKPQLSVRHGWIDLHDVHAST